MKYFTTLVVTGTCLLTGCGAAEDLNESLFKWKVAGDFDLSALSPSLQMYDVEVIGDENTIFDVRKYSATGSEIWQTQISYSDATNSQFFNQTLQTSPQKEDVFLIDKSFNITSKGGYFYNARALDTAGNTQFEIETKDYTGIDKVGYSVSDPGDFIQVSNSEVIVFQNGVPTKIDIPAYLQEFSYREIKASSTGYYVFFTQLNEQSARVSTSVVKVSSGASILWVEDLDYVISFRSDYSGRDDDFVFIKGDPNDLTRECSYGYVSATATGLTEYIDFPCFGDAQLLPARKLSVTNDGVYLASIPSSESGYEIFKYDHHGNVMAQYSLARNVDVFLVAAGSLYQYDDNSLAFAYETTEYLGEGYRLPPSRVQHNVVVLNEDLSVRSERVIPFYYDPVPFQTCYFFCKPEQTDVTGYAIRGIRVMDGEMFVIAEFMDQTSGLRSNVSERYYGVLN